MDTQTLQVLDYFRVRDRVAEFCITEEGRAHLTERLPVPEGMEGLKEEAAEWTRYLNGGFPAAITPWQPVETVFRHLTTAGDTLTPEHARRLLFFCRAVSIFAGRIRGLSRNSGEYAPQPTGTFPSLAARAASLPSLAEQEAHIARVIDRDGAIRDLPELRAIRKSIEKISRDIDDAIKKHLAANGVAFQSNVPVLRGGRQVLAVKAPHRGKIRGIIHEVSQSGQTVFIEPEDVVQKSNDLTQEQFRLDREIRRIMQELTAAISPGHDNFCTALETMIRLDCTLAAARWGIETNGIFAENARYGAALIGARHPLLGRGAIPIDLCFDAGKRVIIISGPNAGGKTVAIKTFALLALLNQSGFPIPAAEGTALPCFSQVFADIGDGQSIDLSLSNFSAHVKNIARFLRSAGEGALVLLDELGSATDPQEGGALGMAILDTLIAHRTFVLVTTHHGALKNYGWTKKECVNASVEFDRQALIPSYHILPGVPGESLALDMAKESGLEAATVEKAWAYLDSGLSDVSALIRGLTERLAEADCLGKELAAREKKLEEKSLKVEEKAVENRLRETELRDALFRQERQFWDEKRNALENLVRELREGEITREKTKKVKQFFADIQADTDRLKNELNTPDLSIEPSNEIMQPDDKTNALDPPLIPALAPGVEVRLKSLRGSGVLLRPAARGAWVVQAGSVKLTADEADMTAIAPPANAAMPLPVSVEYAPEGFAVRHPVLELRLLGMRTRDALKALEQQVDLAVIHGMGEFAVIHGKGEGILQQAVRDYLGACSAVKTWCFAIPEDGGAGKTWVTMRLS
ncbi:MAG: Smr/MutS family protein [Spirochaetaceae bacterium]|jgi:DNA mismatch repair protein MutS2|nr:Smr/MutS family protein [Spirochaetaceae bacterium]